MPHTEITALEGDTLLRAGHLDQPGTGASETRRIGNVFVMIGAEPNTEWLDGCLELDAQGFVRTGRRPATGAVLALRDVAARASSRSATCASGSVKRVASGVGEGSVVVQAVHRFLHPAAE